MIFRKKSKILGLLGIVAVVFTPTTVSAFSFVELTLAVGGVVVGTISTADSVISLAKLAGWDDKNDNPLYSDGVIWPTVTITGDDDEFTLDVKQTLPLDYSVDDEPVEIRGTASIPDPKGIVKKLDAWKFNVTFTYEYRPFDLDTLTSNGQVQHIMAPHPLEESPEAPPLDLSSITITQTIGRPTTLTQKGRFDSRKHTGGSHQDYVKENLLRAQCCDSSFQSWDYRVAAGHAVPEPLTILGSATAVSFGAFFKRKRKLSESSEKDNTKDS